MPVRADLVLAKGWKAEENGRFGPAVVLRFVNPSDNAILFEFAPTLEHQPVMTKLFEDVYAIDDINCRHQRQMSELQVRQEKELRELCDKLHLKSDPYFKAISKDSFNSANKISGGCSK